MESPEAVALELLRAVASVENMSIDGNPIGGQKVADRAWVLDTYRECLRAATIGAKPKTP